jgi:hypothetical protein
MSTATQPEPSTERQHAMERRSRVAGITQTSEGVAASTHTTQLVARFVV